MTDKRKAADHVTHSTLTLLAGSLADLHPTVDATVLTVPITDGVITVAKTDVIDHPSGDIDGYAITVTTPTWSGTPAIADIDCITGIVRTLATIWTTAQTPREASGETGT